MKAGGRERKIRSEGLYETVGTRREKGEQRER